jgi:polyhydroxybutyrate depolymerase
LAQRISRSVSRFVCNGVGVLKKRLLGALVGLTMVIGVVSCGHQRKLSNASAASADVPAARRMAGTAINSLGSAGVLGKWIGEPRKAVAGQSVATATSSNAAAPATTSTSAASSVDKASPAAAAQAPSVPTLAPGLHQFAITLNGLARTWSLVVPPGPAPSKARPLIIALHGADGRGTDMRGLGFEALASAAGYLVAYPDAWEGSWNDGRVGVQSVAHQQQVDDVGFLQALIAQAVHEAGADARRVAVVGISNGAMMASRLACEAGSSLAAVALVDGVGPQDLPTRCNGATALPVVVVAGTADTVVPYLGGPVARRNGLSRGAAASVDSVLDIWLRRDGCSSTKETVVIFAPLRIVEVRGLGCTAGAVRHYRVEGGGHQWFDVGEFHTTAAVWQFIAETVPQG